MIKLTQHHPKRNETVIRVDGCLDAESVTEVQSLLTRLRIPLTIDLAGLTRVDRAGLVYLLGLRDSGVRLQNGSLYISKLLEEAGT